LNLKKSSGSSKLFEGNLPKWGLNLRGETPSAPDASASALRRWDLAVSTRPWASVERRRASRDEQNRMAVACRGAMAMQWIRTPSFITMLWDIWACETMKMRMRMMMMMMMRMRRMMMMMMMMRRRRRMRMKMRMRMRMRMWMRMRIDEDR